MPPPCTAVTTRSAIPIATNTAPKAITAWLYQFMPRSAPSWP